VVAISLKQKYFLASKRKPITISAGAMLTGQPVNWQDSPKNVVLVLSTT